MFDVSLNGLGRDVPTLQQPTKARFFLRSLVRHSAAFPGQHRNNSTPCLGAEPTPTCSRSLLKIVADPVLEMFRLTTLSGSDTESVTCQPCFFLFQVDDGVDTSVDMK